MQYYCCLDCFERLAPREGFKYPANKIILKELPEREKVHQWVDLNTGEKFDEI